MKKELDSLTKEIAEAIKSADLSTAKFERIVGNSWLGCKLDIEGVKVDFSVLKDKDRYLLCYHSTSLVLPIDEYITKDEREQVVNRIHKEYTSRKQYEIELQIKKLQDELQKIEEGTK